MFRAAASPQRLRFARLPVSRSRASNTGSLNTVKQTDPKNPNGVVHKRAALQFALQAAPPSRAGGGAGSRIASLALHRTKERAAGAKAVKSPKMPPTRPQPTRRCKPVPPPRSAANGCVRRLPLSKALLNAEIHGAVFAAPWPRLLSVHWSAE